MKWQTGEKNEAVLTLPTVPYPQTRLKSMSVKNWNPCKDVAMGVEVCVCLQDFFYAF